MVYVDVVDASQTGAKGFGSSCEIKAASVDWTHCFLSDFDKEPICLLRCRLKPVVRRTLAPVVSFGCTSGRDSLGCHRWIRFCVGACDPSSGY